MAGIDSQRIGAFVIATAKDLMESLGVTHTIDGKNVNVLAPSIQSVFDTWEAVRKYHGEAQSFPEITGAHNIQYTKESVKDSAERKSFTGANCLTVIDAFRYMRFDKTPFLEARKSLAPMVRAIETMDVLKAKRRKRFASEHDGEYDFDRQWERSPFLATRIENSGSMSVIDVNCDFTISGGISHSSIAEYGAICWAVIDLLETAGFRCNVFITAEINNSGDTPIGKGVKKMQNRKIKILLKSAEEYIDTMNLARCFTPWFFRRCIFAFWCVFAESTGYDIDYGLGSCIAQFPSAKRGEINLAPELIQWRELKTEKLSNFIKTAITRGES